MWCRQQLMATLSLQHLSEPERGSLLAQIVLRDPDPVREHLFSWQMRQYAVITANTVDMNLPSQFDDGDMLQFWCPTHL